ncbi:DNA primase [Roseiflexus sp.]|uniref:DNA primase n=1 Tax=Roseiflexus sp. TaxID=2562120 RepID=UPI0021DD5974|nr:DNA primase [Roseiflexus sp.]GIV99480.1 MAG: DNA primase [Roseiflexus sp.]
MPGVTDQIKEKIDIVDFISAYVPLRKTGRSYVGFCPFHPNTRTPAFHVFPDTQSFHCFGCKASGTIFDFLMRREGIEFREALERLAQRAGVQLHPRTEAEEQLDRLRTRLLEVNAAAAAFFRHMLVKSQRGEEARAYVAKRRIDDATGEAFLIGYAPDDWSLLLSYLTERRGFAPEEIEAAGLAIHHETRGYYDRFRHRLMFPIRSASGEIVAFGGRALGDVQPKYMNSPQTPLFDKGKVLYGLDLARDAIRQSDAAVIVEGYVDVIIAHQYGFRNVVAPLGTALTADHVALVKKLSHRVYLALDADTAGARATLKGLQALQSQPEGELTAVISPQGVIALQRRQDVEIRILALPEGKDPDEVIQENPEQWRAALAAARPAMDFYIETLTSDLDLSSGRGRAEAVERIAPLLTQIANPVEQAHYIQQLARLIDIEEAHILAALSNKARQEGQRRPPDQGRATKVLEQQPGDAKQQPDETPPPPTQEEYLLSWIIRYPTARAAVEEKLHRDLATYPALQSLMSGTIDELFTSDECRALWRAWIAAPTGSDPQAWATTLYAPLDAVAQRVLELHAPQPQAYRIVNDALECATILQRDAAKRWLVQIARMQTAATGEAEQEILLDQLVQVKQFINMLSIPRRSSAYADLHVLHMP